MNSDIPSILSEGRRLREHGRYVEAVIVLEASLRGHESDVELAVELGETLLIQGYYNRATSVLEEKLTNHDVLSIPSASAGNLICCVARLFCTGQFRESLRLADNIYSAFLSSKESENVNDATVLIESYYCRLWKLANTCGGPDPSHVISLSARRLKAAFDVLLERKEYANALRLSRAYWSCQDGLDPCLLVRTLATDQMMPALYRAEASVLLAKKLGNKNEQDRLYATALRYFEDAGHAHGALEVTISRLCRPPLDPDVKDIEKRLDELFEKCKALDYPAGLSSAYLDLLALAGSLHHFELQTSILKELESLVLSSGSTLLQTMIRITTLATWSLPGGDNAKVVSGATALWADLLNSDCALLRGQAADIASRAYSALKDPDLAIEWSIQAQQDLPVSNHIAILSLARDLNLTYHGHLEKFYTKAVRLVQQDLKKGSVDDAVEKLDILIGHALTHQPLAQTSLDLIETALQWAKNLTQGLTNQEDMSVRLANLFKSEGGLQIKRAASRADVQAENAAIEAFNQAKAYYLKANRIHEAASVLHNLGLTYIGVFQKLEKIRDPDGLLALESALKLFKLALDSFTGMQSVFQISESTYWIGLCQYELWAKNQCSAADVLATLASAERYMDQRRSEVSILQGVQAVVTKRRISSDKHVRNIYGFATQVCRSNGHWNEAWEWVQKSKARSLSDTLGLGVLVPQELLDKIDSQEATRRLFEEERTLLESIYRVSRSESFQAKIQLERHQQEMRKYDSLQELVNLREGVPITLHDLRVITMGRERTWKSRPVIFVDWVISQHNVLMSIVTKDGETVFRTLSITIESLEKWIEDNLNSRINTNGGDDDREALPGLKGDDEPDEGPLRELDVLIQPLDEFSDRDDLLVFCPSGPLHSLPLHALRLGPRGDGEILIKRNPIVYCASLTSFSQCCLRAGNATSSSDASATKSFLAVYEPSSVLDQTVGFDQAEQQQVYSSTDTIAMSLQGKVFCGANVTREVLGKCLEESQFVHFHGHCDVNTKLITEQSLRLSDQAGSTAPLAVKDLFDLRIHASHLSLLACGSAFQHFEAGDEPLGLVTAFLSAGASSVLGALWPVQSRTARKFSEHFYSHLQEARHNEYDVLDLAYAIREAVADTMQSWELRHPYHWAPFCIAWCVVLQRPALIMSVNGNFRGEEVSLIHTSTALYHLLFFIRIYLRT